MKDEIYTRAEVEYMLKKACEEVNGIIYRIGHLSNEEERILIQRLLNKRR